MYHKGNPCYLGIQTKFTIQRIWTVDHFIERISTCILTHTLCPSDCSQIRLYHLCIIFLLKCCLYSQVSKSLKICHFQICHSPHPSVTKHKMNESKLFLIPCLEKESSGRWQQLFIKHNVEHWYSGKRQNVDNFNFYTCGYYIFTASFFRIWTQLIQLCMYAYGNGYFLK